MPLSKSSRRRVPMRLSAVVLVLVSLVILAGCTKADVPERARTAAVDPVIAATLDLASTKGTPAVSGEIRGYLLDWIIDSPGNDESGPIFEAIALKDGSLWRLKAPSMRPSAAFGEMPAKRIGAETPAEADARKKAVALATKALSREHPEFAQVHPKVYGYLIRISFADGTTHDAWVNPNLDNKSLQYDRRLVKWPGEDR